MSEPSASDGPGEGVGPAPPRLARNTAIFAVATGLSRIAGLGREIVAASYYGTSGAASAFTIAFQVPNLVRGLFADAALSAAFVPVFTEYLEHGRKKRRPAARLDALLADPDRPRRAVGAVRRHRRRRDAAVHPRRQLLAAARRPDDRPLSDPVPDRRAARPQRAARRDPQRLQPLHDPGDRSARLEPRDHRHAGRGAAAGSRATTRSTPTRSACCSGRSCSWRWSCRCSGASTSG